MRSFTLLLLVALLGCDDDDDDVIADEGHECSNSSCAPWRLDATVRDASLDAHVPTVGDSAAPTQSTMLSFVPSAQARWLLDAGLGVSVSFFDPQRDKQEVLGELATALQLVRWPSEERVAASVTFDPSLPPYQLQIALTPSQPLVDGDYALRLSPTPARVQVLRGWPNDGLDVSRFYVGSRPAVQRIDLCTKSDARTKVIVMFSEPVRAAAPSVQVSDGDALVSCEAPVLYDSGFEVLCAYQPRSTASVRLQGFESSTGVALRVQDFRFTPSADHGGCASFVPP